VAVPKAKKQKSEVDQACINIKKLVAKYQSATTSATMLLGNIAAGGVWEWAKSPGMTKNLDEALESVKDRTFQRTSQKK